MARLRVGRRFEATAGMAGADEKMEELLGRSWRDARVSGEILGKGTGKRVRVRWTVCGEAVEVEVGVDSPVFASLEDEGHGSSEVRSAVRSSRGAGGAAEDEIIVETDSDMVTEDEDYTEAAGRTGDGGSGSMIDMVDEKGRRWLLEKKEELEDARVPVEESRPRLLSQEVNVTEEGELAEYISCMLPGELLQTILLWTNREIDGGKKQVDLKELRKFFAILLGMLIQPRSELASYWLSRDVGVVRACDFGRTFKMTHARWLFIAHHMRLWDPTEEPRSMQDCVRKLGPVVGLFNQSMGKLMLPGSTVACGEIPLLPPLSDFCGTKFVVRAMVDCASKVVVRVAVEMREEGEAAGVMKLLQGLHSSVVYADQALTSMEACEAVVSSGNHFCGALRSDETFLPVRDLSSGAFGKESEVGATRTFKLKEDFSRPLYCHAWNFRSRRGERASAECFLSSFPAFKPAQAYTRSRQAFDAKYGIIRRNRVVPQSRMVAEHRAAMEALSLKHADLLQTIRSMWKPRSVEVYVFQLLLHLMITNAFLCFKYFDKDAAGVEVETFLNAIAFSFAEKSDCRGILQSCKRKREEQEQEQEQEDGGCKPELIRNSGFGNRHHCGRCKVCPEGQKSYFFCRRCSVLYPGDHKKTKLFYVCGPGTGRDCMMKHLKRTMSEG
ncbi:hypothetical protein GUITHDRAFT_136619 [Guillardia theta CCMP2712]|uniref:PiggyBac transposable element-derived protein domain-containing protein n=1 Tax=Guillardia theta (strain CCMP2712) TaxID=905079 RepID=L1JIZ2_GUITC|nr:hypothetical protein GUITHDRAFT_136619 [Guillardia theta CCMP2712]EKX48493.1 hypothetical protein GUITHDRAFT_136619 [Guillardia theta CCMP2712]|eukprot:XP_005835473.1 hypothetical protein GUITHDRAFT_136619 [Guillardia theta CCMP2712]